MTRGMLDGLILFLQMKQPRSFFFQKVPIHERKKFPFGDQHSFEVRADVFNVAYRTNFAPPITNFANAAFG